MLNQISKKIFKKSNKNPTFSYITKFYQVFTIKMSSRNYGSGQRNYRQRNYRRTRQFMANNTRLINNLVTINRIARITSQITNNSNNSLESFDFENCFFNGTNFNNNNDFESLILPAGCSSSSAFP